METIEERARYFAGFAGVCEDCDKAYDPFQGSCSGCKLRERYEGYIKGATDQQAIFDKLPKVKAWVARDKDGDIYMYTTLAPEKNRYYWVCQYGYFKLTEDQLPEGCNPQWEDSEPIEVELMIKMK